MRPAAARAKWRGLQVALLIGSLALAVSGCLVLPMNHPVSHARVNVSEKTVSELQPGVTRKEDVILKLGEPDRISDDGRSLGYAWSRLRLVWIVAFYGLAAGEVTKDGLLQLTFDQDNLLLKTELRKKWLGSSSMDRGIAERDQWEAPAQGSRLVMLQPRLHGSIPAPLSIRPLNVAVLEMLDQRVERDWVGEWKLLGMDMGKFSCSGSITDFLRQELINEISQMGHKTADKQAEITITPRLTRVWIKGKPTASLLWDITAEVEFDLIFTSVGRPERTVSRHYTGRRTLITTPVSDGTAEFFGRVLNDSIDDLMAKVRSDAVWQSWPESNPES